MKNPFGRPTLRQRLVLLPTLLCGLSLAALVSLFSYLGTDFAEKAALDTLQAATRERAAMVKEEIEVALSEAETLALSFEAMQQAGTVDRLAYRRVIDHFMRRHPRYLGGYAMWEPNALDGRDAEFAGQWTAIRKGARGSTPTMTTRGSPTSMPSSDAPYYTEPRATNRPAMIEPYAETTGGVGRVMTSAVVPLRSAEGTFIGIAGVDLALDHVRDMVVGLRPAGVRSVGVISANGQWVAHSDAKLQMQPATGASIAAASAAGGTLLRQDIGGQDTVLIAVPVAFSEAATTWSFVVKCRRFWRQPGLCGPRPWSWRSPRSAPRCSSPGGSAAPSPGR